MIADLLGHGTAWKGRGTRTQEASGDLPAADGASSNRIRQTCERQPCKHGTRAGSVPHERDAGLVAQTCAEAAVQLDRPANKLPAYSAARSRTSTFSAPNPGSRPQSTLPCGVGILLADYSACLQRPRLTQQLSNGTKAKGLSMALSACPRIADLMERG